MKAVHTFSFLLFFCLITTACVAQPKGHFAEWGKVTVDELRMTECSFEKNADALLLLDMAQMYYSKIESEMSFTAKFVITTSYYQRMKVFNERGTHRADFKLTVRGGNDEAINNIRGVCYNLVNGKIQIISLHPEDVHVAKVNGASIISFTIPGVSAESVFEVGYDRVRNASNSLPTWYFTNDIPCARSSITIGFLDALSYYMDIHLLRGYKYEKEIEHYRSDITVSAMVSMVLSKIYLNETVATYTMDNIKSYRAEPFGPAPRNYMNWMGFQLNTLSSPFDVSKNASIIKTFSQLRTYLLKSENFESNLKNNPVAEKEWPLTLSNTMLVMDKAKIIYDYVRSSIQCNGNTGIRPTDTNKRNWKNKTGSQTDINLLLISALRDFNIEAYPMLITNRSIGSIDTTYPIIDEYVGIDALVRINGRDFVLDATSRVLPFGEPATEQLNTLGLVLKGDKENFWHVINSSTPCSESVLISASIDENGVIHGKMDLIYSNQMADGMIRVKNSSSQAALEVAFKQFLPGVAVESADDTIDPSNCYFTHRINFTSQPVTDNEGNIYISLANFYGISANPFSSPDRIADIDFGFRYRRQVTLILDVPAAYQVDPVFHPGNLINEDTTIIYLNKAETDDNVVTWQENLTYKKSFYTRAEYESLFDFQKRYLDTRQKPLILRKKI